MSRPGTGVENLQTVSVVAELQLALGRTAEGTKTMDKALGMADATPVDIHQIARFQQMQGDPELAKRIFLMNAKRFPNRWPVNVGLARYHAMSGDNKQAIAFAQKAMAQAPDEGDKRNLEGLIRQWSATAAK